MNATVTPHNLSGKVSAVGAKLFAHRALIAAAFFQKQPTLICGVTPSDDVSATVGCLRALGVEVCGTTELLVTPPEKFCSKAVLDCKQSGSTYRFLLPVVVALGIDAEFCGSERLFNRPIEPLIRALQGCGVDNGKRVHGKMRCGDFHVDGSESSQFVSGMLFALALLDGQSRLFVDGERVSQGYVHATVSVLQSFGVQVEATDFGFVVNGGRFVERSSFAVEGDWTNASYFLVAGALGGDVAVTGLNATSVQADNTVVDVLKNCGAKVAVENDVVHVRGGNLLPFDVDAADIPDIVPTLAVLAAFCNGTSKICGIERLRGKESDRVKNVLQTLHGASVKAEYQNGTLSVHGGCPQGGTFFADGDHRMAMSQTLLALYAKGTSKICGSECVSKSYPEFFDEVKKLGGNCVLLERS